MKKNVGSIDKTLRLVLGVVVAAVGIYYQSWWGLIALPLIGTALMNSCPAYMPFGISTKKAADNK
jgi:hypothetical protein